jgi:O-antigen/teichoic acid export membrane protein
MSPFRNILKLFAGDLTAKALNFLVFVYLARILGVTNYGTLEFAFSALAYFLLLGSFGVEVWATREAAWGGDIRRLTGKTILLRLIFSSVSFALLVALYSYFPEYTGLKPLLLTLGASIFITALNLKWVFLGREQMARVAIGLIIGQAIFAGTVFVFVHDPSDVVLVAIFWLLGEVAAAGYFAWLYFREYSLKGFQFSLGGMKQDIRPILTFGATQAMGLLSYNFDVLVMGFLLGSDPVGLYRAAYKPITAALALPMTFFMGLFPALSRTHQSDPDDFRKIADRAQNLSSIFSVPFALGGIFFAGPIILLLFGAEYARSAPVMQLLALALGITLLRGTYRNGLAAAGYQHLDLLSAGLAVSANLLLNIYLIPRLGMTGAALATIGSELTWLVTSRLYFTRKITKIGFGKHLVRPLIAGFLMVLAFYLAREVYWPIQATLGLAVYFGGLLILGEGEVRSWVVRLWPVSS